MICAMIDVGSNTIRLSVYQYNQGKAELILNNKTTAGLVSYIENEKISEKGIEIAANTISNYKNHLADFGIDELHVFATASLRNITNTQQALEQIKQKTDVTVNVLSGRQEAVLDFIGASYLLEEQNGVLVDIGGGSTELVLFQDKKIIRATSIPIGSLNLYLKKVKALLPDSGERKSIKKQVIKELKQQEGFKGLKSDVICGVGGTFRSALKLGNEIFDLPKDNTQLNLKQINGLLELFHKADKKTIRQIIRTVPDRIHTIIPGMVEIYAIASHFGCQKIVVSKYGVREGYLYHHILKEVL